jgi:hypothetical protein
MKLRVGDRVQEPSGRHVGRVEAIHHGRSSRSQPRRRRPTLTRPGAECLEALREVGPDVHVSQFAVLEMRRVAKLVAKGRARWTAYGVKLRTKRGE